MSELLIKDHVLAALATGANPHRYILSKAPGAREVCIPFAEIDGVATDEIIEQANWNVVSTWDACEVRDVGFSPCIWAYVDKLTDAQWEALSHRVYGTNADIDEAIYQWLYLNHPSLFKGTVFEALDADTMKAVYAQYPPTKLLSREDAVNGNVRITPEAMGAFEQWYEANR